VLLLALAGAGFGVKVWLSREQGWRQWQDLLLRLPQIGRATRSFATARVVRLLGVLLDCRVPLLEALKLTREAAGHYRYARLLAQAEEAVSRGEPISAVFRECPLVAPSVYEAIHNGEQTGQVAPLLLGIADFLDDENDTLVRSLTSILEPVILIGLGVLVGFVAVSLFMPLFDLTAMTGSGGGG
jgi:type II secretory pathway component PulF